MAVVHCTQCEWRVQQDELWDERCEEHYLETNHTVFKTIYGQHLPGSDV